jgi:hypothetical protein
MRHFVSNLSNNWKEKPCTWILYVPPAVITGEGTSESPFVANVDGDMLELECRIGLK